MNDHCPFPNLFAYRETSLAFARHSFSLSFDPYEMSLNIDMKMILPVKVSGKFSGPKVFFLKKKRCRLTRTDTPPHPHSQTPARSGTHARNRTDIFLLNCVCVFFSKKMKHFLKLIRGLFCKKSKKYIKKIKKSLPKLPAELLVFSF